MDNENSKEMIDEENRSKEDQLFKEAVSIIEASPWAYATHNNATNVYIIQISNPHFLSRSSYIAKKIDERFPWLENSIIMAIHPTDSFTKMDKNIILEHLESQNVISH